MIQPIQSLRHLWMLVLIAISGLSLQAQSSAELRSLFWKQISSTCRPGLKWEKSVVEIAGDGTFAPETKVFDVDCYRGFATSGDVKVPLNPEEFGHLFEYTFDNPSYADRLVVDRAGKSVEAVVKAGAEKDCKLQMQAFEVDSSGVMRSAYAHILKESPLYDLEVQ